MRKKGGMLPRLQIPLSTKLWLSNKARFLANHGKTRHPDSLMYQNMITEIIWCFEDGISCLHVHNCHFAWLLLEFIMFVPALRFAHGEGGWLSMGNML